MPCCWWRSMVSFANIYGLCIQAMKGSILPSSPKPFHTPTPTLFLPAFPFFFYLCSTDQDCWRVEVHNRAPPWSLEPNTAQDSRGEGVCKEAAGCSLTWLFRPKIWTHWRQDSDLLVGTPCSLPACTLFALFFFLAPCTLTRHPALRATPIQLLVFF